MNKIIKSLKFDPEFRPVNISPVLKQRVVSAYGEAKEIIAQARAEAERIHHQAHETSRQATEEKESERQRGYEEGYQEGLSQLTQKVLEVEQAHEKMMADAEPQMVQMVMDIAEKVIGRQIEKGAIVDIVKNAISQAAGRKIIIRLHPTDVIVIREREKELFAVLDQNQSVNVKEDDEIPAGGCIVETEMGTVDARLETQLAAIRKALGLL